MWHIPARAVGASALGEGQWQFRVWAPAHERLDLHIVYPSDRVIPMEREDDGYFVVTVDHLSPDARYFIRFADGRERPDPASRFQPEGVHGPSQVVAPFAAWTDDSWSGIPLSDYLLYEIHIGTFSAVGTFLGAIPYLDDLVALGVTAVEIMPIAQFPGKRNWGYDGVDLFAVQQSYGTPADFAMLVDACHARGLAVVLDVVYNHIGPEGNYLAEFGPYFTDTYKTPWGSAINFDGPENAEVRAFFIQNAQMWVRDVHIDALRLDAVQAIMDVSAQPFLADLARTIHQTAADLHRHIVLFAESDANDLGLLDPPERNGLGVDAQWSDEFHHVVHTLLTGETVGYYADYGLLEQLARALTETFVFAGEFSTARRRRHGAPVRHIAPGRFVFSIQNHDQVGNRLHGERLSHLVPFACQKLAAGLLLLAPATPLIFMGEEFAERHPFLYFVDHGDPALVAAVRAGRRAEFATFEWQGDPPDPANPATFMMSRLDRSVRATGHHAILYALYRKLLGLRRSLAPLRHMRREALAVTVYEESDTLVLHRWDGDAALLAVFHLGNELATQAIMFPAGRWECLLDSAASPWALSATPSAVPAVVEGDQPASVLLAPCSFVVYTRQPAA